MMIKDCVFCQLLRDKVSIPIPDMQLKVNKNRPFSMHRKIKGVSLLSQMDTIKPSDLDAIVSDLALFLSQLHALSLDIMKDDMKENLADFLDNLASVHQGDYDFSFKRKISKLVKRKWLYRMGQNREFKYCVSICVCNRKCNEKIRHYRK